MAVRGEEGARALYRAYGDELYRFALKRLRDPALAEEVVQDVFLRAWRHQDQFDPQRASQRTWLFEIARNLTTDALRRRSVRPVSSANGARWPSVSSPATLRRGGRPLADRGGAGRPARGAPRGDPARPLRGPVAGGGGPARADPGRDGEEPLLLRAAQPARHPRRGRGDAVSRQSVRSSRRSVPTCSAPWRRTRAGSTPCTSRRARNASASTTSSRTCRRCCTSRPSGPPFPGRRRARSGSSRGSASSTGHRLAPDGPCSPPPPACSAPPPRPSRSSGSASAPASRQPARPSRWSPPTPRSRPTPGRRRSCTPAPPARWSTSRPAACPDSSADGRYVVLISEDGKVVGEARFTVNTDGWAQVAVTTGTEGQRRRAARGAARRTGRPGRAALRRLSATASRKSSRMRSNASGASRLGRCVSPGITTSRP